jgi:hypothetical protein
MEQENKPMDGKENLEDKISDKKSEGLIKKAAKLGYAGTVATLATALSTSFVGTTGIIIGSALAAGQVVGSAIKGGKTLYNHVVDSLKTYANANIFITPALKVWDYTMPLIGGTGLAGFLAKGLYASTLYNGYFTALTRATGHLVNNYMNPFGIIDTVTKDYYKEWKRNAIGFSPAWFAAPYIPSIAGYPTFAYNAFPLSMYNAINPIRQPKQAEEPSSEKGKVLHPEFGKAKPKYDNAPAAPEALSKAA